VTNDAVNCGWLKIIRESSLIREVILKERKWCALLADEDWEKEKNSWELITRVEESQVWDGTHSSPPWDVGKCWTKAGSCCNFARLDSRGIKRIGHLSTLSLLLSCLRRTGSLGAPFQLASLQSLGLSHLYIPSTVAIESQITCSATTYICGCEAASVVSKTTLFGLRFQRCIFYFACSAFRRQAEEIANTWPNPPPPHVFPNRLWA